MIELLEGISIVDSFTIAEVAGDTIRLRVAAVGGAERLARALRLAGLLEEERIDAMPGFGMPVPVPVPESLDFYFES